jgi:transcription initiation factor TFIIIB Brf1 subunit/transcription initiation factor TFIIB
MIKNIHQVKECPECGSKNIRYDEEKNQVICEDCGLIYEPMAPKVEKKFEKASKQK